MKSAFINKFVVMSVFFIALVSPLPGDVGGHRGAVTALIHIGNSIISGGDDGFMGIWNVRDASAVERFQLTPHKIKAMVKHPFKDEICIIESGSLDQYGISVWNYRRKERIFFLRSRENVTYINYSAGGSFIIAAGFDGHTLAVLDSTSGRAISFQDELTGAAAFAMTGRAERNILVYQSRNERAASARHGGSLSYVDLDSGAISNRFEAPGGLASPIIFGNNRYLAGINSEGLLVLDAASGAVVGRMGTINQSALLSPANNGFLCISREQGDTIMYRFEIDNGGNLVTRERRALAISTAHPVSAFASAENMALGTAEGEIFLSMQQGRISRMAHNIPVHITEIAAARSSIALLTENGGLCFLPLNYRLLERTLDRRLTLENKNGFTRINSLSANEEDQFILWQTADTRLVPVLIKTNYQADENALGFSHGRFPLRSISSRNNKVLFLDAGGNVSVYDQNNPDKKAIYTFSAVGAIDAAFINSNNFVLCRSVISGNSPFLLVNIATGETLPLPYPSRAGIMVYAGDSGDVYAGAVEQVSAEIKTTVLALSTTTAGRTRKIHEYHGEDVHLSVAESAGMLAVASDGEGAAIHADKIINFERTEGLPVKLLGCPEFFISLDSEGNISWHDNKSGKLLAVFRLYADKWTLTSDRVVSGTLSRP